MYSVHVVYLSNVHAVHVVYVYFFWSMLNHSPLAAWRGDAVEPVS